MINLSELVRESKNAKDFMEPISAPCHQNHNYRPFIRTSG